MEGTQELVDSFVKQVHSELVHLKDSGLMPVSTFSSAARRAETGERPTEIAGATAAGLATAGAQRRAARRSPGVWERY